MKQELKTLEVELAKHNIQNFFTETPKRKSGYCITVTSWENDADNYKTASLDGLTLENSVTICRVLQLLDRNHPDNNNYTETSKYCGNINDYSYEKRMKIFIRELQPILLNNPTFFSSYNFDDVDILTEELLAEIGNTLYEYILEAFLSDLQLCGENYSTRVVENVTIEFIE